MGRMQGKSGGKASVAAKGSEAKSAVDQPVSAPEVAEKISVDGGDNNKRLAALEGQLYQLSLAMAANCVKPDREDGAGYDDPIGVAIDVIRGIDGRIEHAVAKASEVATPGELAAIKRAEEAEANYEAASNQLAAIQTFILSHDDFKTVEGEELPETVIRFVGGQEPGPIADGDPGREQLGRLVAGQVESFTALPAIASFSLMFADGDAVLDVDPRSVSLEEISRDGERAVYDRRLTFSPAQPPHNITAVWLVAFDPGDSEGVGGVAAVRCEVPGGLRVGGGAMAAIPAGHLIF